MHVITLYLTQKIHLITLRIICYLTYMQAHEYVIASQSLFSIISNAECNEVLLFGKAVGNDICMYTHQYFVCHSKVCQHSFI